MNGMIQGRDKRFMHTRHGTEQPSLVPRNSLPLSSAKYT